MGAPTMYHYTCDHGLPGIVADGVVKPNQYTGVAWFTDLPIPDVKALGLTSIILDCDRIAHRFRVTKLTNLRRYEGPPLMGQPWHWWIADQPVPVVLDEITDDKEPA